MTDAAIECLMDNNSGDRGTKSGRYKKVSLHYLATSLVPSIYDTLVDLMQKLDIYKSL